MDQWLRKLVSYFDLRGDRSGIAAENAPTMASVWPQYLTVAAGVIVEPFLRKYMDTGAWGFTQSIFLGRVLFGLIIAIILLPAVYRSAFDADKPVVVQLAALFPMGIGWQSLVNVGATAVAGH